MAHKVGDRVAFVNFGYVNLGTVREVADVTQYRERYRVDWDDGFWDDDSDYHLSGDGSYGVGELLEVH